MAYQAFTVYGQSFQIVLLATLISYLMQAGDSTCFQNGILDCGVPMKPVSWGALSSAPSWLFVMSQPLLDIRLSTYPSELTDRNLKSLGSYRFARHYSGNRCLLSFPRGTKMFQFPRFPSSSVCVQLVMTRHDPSRISPFGHLRFIA